MPFFIRNKAHLNEKNPKVGKFNKRKDDDSNAEPAKKRKRKLLAASEEILSDSDADSGDERKRKQVEESSSEEDEETAQETRLRLAKDYLTQLHAQEAEKEDDDSAQQDLISHRLQQDVLMERGKLHKNIASEVEIPDVSALRVLRGHQLPVTCLVITPDDKCVFTASKDCSIIKWDVASGSKLKVIHGGRKGTEEKHTGHTAHILCMAISSDNQYLVSGDANKLDNKMHVWNPDTCEHIHTFTGHRDAVSGLVFRKNTHQLFSASHDRSVKLWNLDELAYVESLFGHQDGITSIDSLTRERAITAGGGDSSIRVWKIIEESQLVFHGHKGSIDCISLINEEHFVSGASDNTLALWGIHKKKPITTVVNAHSGTGDVQNTDESWISAVTALPNSDLIATGSKDGCIRLWCCSADFKSLRPIGKVPAVGFVNGLRFSSNGDFLVAAIGQEHRLGRWWRDKKARNSTLIIPLNRKTQAKQS